MCRGSDRQRSWFREWLWSSPERRSLNAWVIVSGLQSANWHLSYHFTYKNKKTRYQRFFLAEEVCHYPFSSWVFFQVLVPVPSPWQPAVFRPIEVPSDRQGSSLPLTSGFFFFSFFCFELLWVRLQAAHLHGSQPEGKLLEVYFHFAVGGVFLLNC